ncbi:hypothetical protein BDV96DRAFT_653446 [Lophiotrema nucula]|uniref:BTB domain-containing protein n=1 Tax=Lophiotrema nucula TaxID=690887 RepID=A0A6A5YN88_9PLEO|nr:hypothetical protein BDV96DRAFT_653446 [Lophiotrema nucula]
MDSPNVELVSALASLYESSAYSDLTITVGARRYQVHKAIVCSRSEFLAGCMRNPLQESQSGVIDLSEDDPDAVEHMVNYFYHLDYLTKPSTRRTSQRSSQPVSPLSPRLSSRTQPKKFNLAMVEDPLMAMASAANAAPNLLTPPADYQENHFETDLSAKLPDTPMADQDEQDPFETVQTEQEADVEKPNLILHAKVYEIAERYGIPGLKTLARKKFGDQLQLHLTSTEFPEACQEVYESTVDSDRGLRDIVIQTFRANPDLSLRKDVEQVIRETPGLAFELFRMANGLPVFS